MGRLWEGELLRRPAGRFCQISLAGVEPPSPPPHGNQFYIRTVCTIGYSSSHYCSSATEAAVRRNGDACCAFVAHRPVGDNAASSLRRTADPSLFVTRRWAATFRESA
eukprot:gb/GEZN01025646.1/.p1 GENE.gb/GEZN01025646.1/~~gb/GEZN01025646.1/.p1  ORF type:complete len:108 (-),score=6.75 gb/GEZN01025646.1/:14-337(-)